MAVNVPLPVGNYGKADWKDFDNNWRELDAEWLQDRAIMRFLTTANRNTAYPSPVGPGQVVYNDETGILELYKGGAWTAYRPIPTFLTVPANDATQVVLEHVTGGAGKGLTFKPAGLITGGALTVGGTLTVLTNALIADATGLSLKVGAKTVKLTTDATNLVVDSPVSAPSIKLTGTGTVVDAGTQAIVGGALTVTSATVNGNLSVTGNITGTLTGGLNSAAGGSVGGVTLASSVAYASAGFVSQAAYFFGSSTQARIRQRDTASPFGLGSAGFDITDTVITALGSWFDVYGQFRIRSGGDIEFVNTAGSTLGHLGPVVYTATAIVATNYPEGTIWVTP